MTTQCASGRTSRKKSTNSSSGSEKRKEWEKKIGQEFESKSQYLIPILQFVQGKAGYLPPEAMQAVARFLKIPESKVYGVASFYAQFYFHPRGRNTLTICRGTACHVRGSARLLTKMEQSLGVSPGQATEDLSFSLETVACFGACALAPVAVINDQVYRQQTPLSLKNLVKNVRRETMPSSRTHKATRSDKGKKKRSSAGKTSGKSTKAPANRTKKATSRKSRSR